MLSRIAESLFWIGRFIERSDGTARIHRFFGGRCEGERPTRVGGRQHGIVGGAQHDARRDEAWRFFSLGRALEQADMTARLLATKSLTQASGASWTTILRSVGAYEAYLRTYRGMPSSQNAAEFLLLDRLFPRSILFSVTRAEEYMRALEPRADRVGVGDNAQRLLGQIRSELQYRPSGDIIDELPKYMDDVQAATSAASNAIRQRYFPANDVSQWVGERT